MTIQTQIVGFGQNNVDALVKSGTIAVEGIKEIGTASADILSQSTARTQVAVQTLLAVKSPAELPNIVIALAKSNFESVVADGRKLQELVTGIATSSVAPFTALFNRTPAPAPAPAASKKIAKAA